MTSVDKSSLKQGREAWPNDSLLTEYLLGSLASDSRHAVEMWLGEQPCNGERLCELSEDLLSISKIADSFVMPVKRRDDVQASSTVIYRLVGTVLALAVTLLLIFFSLDGFSSEDAEETRIAMVWAESLPGTSEELPDWILESNSTDSNLLTETDDLFVSDEVIDDDASETDEMFGFSSHEPPDWLLAGVRLMETAGSTVEVNEAIQ